MQPQKPNNSKKRAPNSVQMQSQKTAAIALGAIMFTSIGIIGYQLFNEIQTEINSTATKIDRTVSFKSDTKVAKGVNGVGSANIGEIVGNTGNVKLAEIAEISENEFKPSKNYRETSLAQTEMIQKLKAQLIETNKKLHDLKRQLFIKNSHLKNEIETAISQAVAEKDEIISALLEKNNITETQLSLNELKLNENFKKAHQLNLLMAKERVDLEGLFDIYAEIQGRFSNQQFELENSIKNCEERIAFLNNELEQAKSEIDLRSQREENLYSELTQKSEKLITLLAELENLRVGNNLELVESLGSVESVNNSESLSSVESKNNSESLSSVEPANNSESLSSVEPANNSESLSSVEPANNSESLSSVEPANNSESLSSVEPANNSESLSSVEPANNSESLSSVEPANNSESLNHIESVSNSNTISSSSELPYSKTLPLPEPLPTSNPVNYTEYENSLAKSSSRLAELEQLYLEKATEADKLTFEINQIRESYNLQKQESENLQNQLITAQENREIDQQEIIRLTTLLDASQYTVTSLRDTISGKKNSSEELNNELARLMSELNFEKEKNLNLQVAQEKSIKLEHDLGKLQKLLKEKEDQIDQLMTAKQTPPTESVSNNTNSHLENEIKEREEIIYDLTQQISVATETILALQNKEGSKTNLSESEKSDTPNLSEEVKSNQEKLISLNQELENLKNENSALAKNMAKYTTLESEHANQIQKIKELEDFIKKHEAEVDELTTALSTMTQQLESNREMIARNELHQNVNEKLIQQQEILVKQQEINDQSINQLDSQEIQTLTLKVNQLTTEINEKESIIIFLNEQVKKTEGTISDLQTIILTQRENSDSHLKQIESLIAELDILQKKNQNLYENNEKIALLESELTEERHKTNELKEIIESHKEEIRKLIASIEVGNNQLESERNRLMEAQAQSESLLNDKINDLTTKLEAREQMVNSLNEQILKSGEMILSLQDTISHQNSNSKESLLKIESLITEISELENLKRMNLELTENNEKLTQNNRALTENNEKVLELKSVLESELDQERQQLTSLKEALNKELQEREELTLLKEALKKKEQDIARDLKKQIAESSEIIAYYEREIEQQRQIANESNQRAETLAMQLDYEKYKNDQLENSTQNVITLESDLNEQKSKVQSLQGTVNSKLDEIHELSVALNEIKNELEKERQARLALETTEIQQLRSTIQSKEDQIRDLVSQIDEISSAFDEEFEG